jgi:hypothetical protein
MTARTTTPSMSRSFVFLTLAVCALISPRLLAQYGVSPSQTGQFFDDLRGRADARAQAQGMRSGEGVYDYERGAYVSGDDSNSENFYDASSNIGRPANSAGTSTYSQRRSADYTQYSSPYPSSSSFFAPTYTSDPYLGGKRNLKVGPVNVGFGMSGLVEYNDNITRASGLTKDADGKIIPATSDIIASAFLNIDARYQLTETNALTLSSAIGIDRYIDHPELSPYGKDFSVNVLPGSTLSFDGKLGPVYFVIFDRVSMRPAVRNDFALNTTEIFGVFQNDIGLGASWSINSSLNLALNYTHSDALALEDSAKKYDRSMDSIQASLAWSPTGAWTTGLEGGMTFVRYPEHYNNDGVLANAGVFFASPIGKSTFVRVAGGMQHFKFDDPARFQGTANEAKTKTEVDAIDAKIAKLNQEIADPATSEADTKTKEQEVIGLQSDRSAAITQLQNAQSADSTAFNQNTHDVSDLNDYYANVTISNRLTSRISHALSFGHESALNTTSNFITADYVSYGVGIIAWRGSRLALSGYFEDATESGGTESSVVTDKDNVDGNKLNTTPLKEDVQQYGFDAYFSHQLSPRVRMGLGYHYGIADSNKVNRDYTQNAFNIDVNFLVTEKLNMAFGYRFYTTEAETPDLGFDQNRFIMSMNYNF